MESETKYESRGSDFFKMMTNLLNRYILYKYHEALVPFCWAVRLVRILSTLQ